MHIVEVFGRIFIASLFLVEAIRKFLDPDMSMMYMSDHSVPEFLFYPSLAVEFFLPLLLIAGFKTKIVASLLGIFVLAVTLIFHTDFSNNHIFIVTQFFFFKYRFFLSKDLFMKIKDII